MELEEETIPTCLQKFGVIKKVLQKAKPEDEDTPYWASMHKYDMSLPNWGKFNIQIQPFQQSGFKHYFGVIELGVADLVCCVPSLPESTDSLEIAKRTIQEDATDQYQRPIEFERIDNLEHYLSEDPNIVNPIILHVPVSSHDNESVTVLMDEHDNYTLNIDLQKVPFIGRTGTDVEPRSNTPDHRPLDLVDGQHRVRASRNSEKANSVKVPFVLLDTKMDRNDAARIFAEINVQQKALKDLHKLHLRYVMKLASHEPAQDFGEVSESYMNMEDEWEKDSKMARRYANRMAYRIGAKLTLDRQSPLHGLIKYYYDSNELNAIDAKDWVDYAHEWILAYYHPDSSEERVIEIIQAYFDAWKLTANTNPRTGELFDDLQENNRWGRFKPNDKGKKPKSKAFQKASFKAFMSLYPTVLNLSKVHEIEDYGEMVKAFSEVLTPCQAIDFIDVEAWKRVITQGVSVKQSEQYLYHWMAWAIIEYQKTGTTPPVEAVWNTEEGSIVDSRAGQGFFSTVNPDLFRGTIQVTNMTSMTEIAGTTIGITADALPNESHAKTISISYFERTGKKIPLTNSGKQRKGPHKSVGANYHTNQFSKAQDERGIQSVQIRITSGNIFGSEADEIFSQTYTLAELFNINNQRILLTNSTHEEGLDSSSSTNQKISTDEIDYEMNEGDEKEDTGFTGELDLDFGPLPPNKPVYSKIGYAIHDCMHCFFGNDHKCGLQ